MEKVRYYSMGQSSANAMLNGWNNSPAINVSHVSFRSRFSVSEVEKLFNPGDKVVFETTFDDLVKYVGGQCFMNISAGEIIGEWLQQACI